MASAALNSNSLFITVRSMGLMPMESSEVPAEAPSVTQRAEPAPVKKLLSMAAFGVMLEGWRPVESPARHAYLDGTEVDRIETIQNAAAAGAVALEQNVAVVQRGKIARVERGDSGNQSCGILPAEVPFNSNRFL